MELVIEVVNFIREGLGLKYPLLHRSQKLYHLLVVLVIRVHNALVIEIHLAGNPRNKALLSDLVPRHLAFAEARVASLLLGVVEVRYRLPNNLTNLILLDDILLSLIVKRQLVLLIDDLQVGHLANILLRHLGLHLFQNAVVHECLQAHVCFAQVGHVLDDSQFLQFLYHFLGPIFIHFISVSTPKISAQGKFEIQVIIS